MPLIKGYGSVFGSRSCFFVIDLQDANKKLIYKKSFSAYYDLKLHWHNFLFYDRRKIEGSGSGSIPLTNGSGSEGGPKTCGPDESGSGFGSGTLEFSIQKSKVAF
jgi:hypothetical protein